MWLAIWTHRAVHVEGEKSERAVHAIGTNALPFLLEWSRYESPRLNLKQLLWSVSPRFCRHWSFWVDPAAWRAGLAPIGFGILGSTADSAIPELGRIANTSKDERTILRAVEALKGIGPTAVPTLISLAASTNLKCRFFAIGALRVSGTNAAPAVPVLIECLRDKESSIAMAAAAEALLELKLEPQTTFAAWTNTLNDPRPDLRWFAVRSIAGFDKRAYPVVPGLVRMLGDQDRIVRSAAANELREIAPEAITKTPAR